MRIKGDRYRPIVTIIKAKKGVPSVIRLSGRTYILQHENQYTGGRKTP